MAFAANKKDAIVIVMERIKKLIKEIEAENISVKKEHMLLHLPKHIEDILLKISACANIQEAEYYFSILEDAKHLVAIIISEDKVEVSDPLWKLYKDFDRIDDKEWREYLFNKIKTGKYSLAGEPALYDWFPRK